MKRISFLLSMYLLPGLALAAKKATAAAPKGLAGQIVDAGICMVSECSPLTLVFVIVPAVAVYIYKKYIVVS